MLVQNSYGTEQFTGSQDTVDFSMKSKDSPNLQKQSFDTQESLKDRQIREQAIFGLKRVDDYLMDIKKKTRGRLLQLKQGDKSVQGAAIAQIQDLTQQVDALRKQNKELAYRLAEIEFQDNKEQELNKVQQNLDNTIKQLTERIHQLGADNQFLRKQNQQTQTLYLGMSRSYKEIEINLSQHQQQAALNQENQQQMRQKIEHQQQENKLIHKKYQEALVQLNSLKTNKEGHHPLKNDPLEEQENRNSQVNGKINSKELESAQSLNSILERDLHKAKQEVLLKQQQIDMYEQRENDYKLQIEQNKLQKPPVKKQFNKSTRQNLVKGLLEIQKIRYIKEELTQDLLDMESAFFSDDLIKDVTSYVFQQETKLLQQQGSQQKSKAAEKKLQRQTEALQEAQQTQKQLREDADIQKDAYEYQLKAQRIELGSQTNYYKAKYQEEFDRRKKLHNELLEIKGNIRVFVRIRPLLQNEVSNGKGNVIEPLSEETLHIQHEKLTRNFEFDRVFGDQSSQEVVFEDVKMLITSVMDGFNVCIMAYGQTGSGKTYTMQGPQENPGVNIRALQELFNVRKEREKSYEYKIEASVIEVYNEQIFDLLQSKKEQSKLEVKEDHSRPQGVFVANLTVRQISNMEEASQLLNLGQKHRHSFFTNMNEHSSRSHLVLTVYVTYFQKQQNLNSSSPQKNQGVTRAKLQLVDLAGSERLSQSGAQGQRLKETQAINSSLATLGDVLYSLRDRKQHIPYRNSKLTRVLSDSLGGQAKTLMFINVSPTQDNYGESKVSLEFGSRAQKVELNSSPLVNRSIRHKHKDSLTRGDLTKTDDSVKSNNSRIHT